MVITVTNQPFPSFISSIFFTSPDMEEKTLAEIIPSASANKVPTLTLSPIFTLIFAGVPMCCLTGM